MKNTLFLLGTSVMLLLVGCDGSSGSSSGDNGGNAGNSGDGSAGSNFVTFESGQVRPLALSSSGDRLYAINTPGSSLEVLSVDDAGIALLHSIPVGLEPVAVSLRSDSEAWVVNHLSDSISIVDLQETPPRVVNTLLVADEPRDIVFAGAQNSLAFVTTAHRGQNGPNDSPIDAQLQTPGVGRTDVWVFDASNTGDSLGGDPLNVVSLFGDTARSLAVSPNGELVYVAVMNSGNRTTAIGENFLSKPGPVASADGIQQPDTGLIIQYDGSQWVDAEGNTSDLANRSYGELVPFSLPDYDVFVLDATPDANLITQYSGVGTNLFNMVSNPANGQIYVSNTDALNVNRFEGDGTESSTVRGDFVRNRVSIIDGDNVLTRDLNNHIDRAADAATSAQRSFSVAQPMGMAIDASGSRLYVTAFGSEKLVVYDIEALLDGSIDATTASHVVLSGGGPTGVVLDEARDTAYVFTRFDNSVVSVDMASLTEVQAVSLFNPEPEHVVAGRELLYNAADNSRFGDSSCASCHLFADSDGLAWDLGNPDETVRPNPNEFVNGFLRPPNPTLHPMKGPMGTQSLRGMAEAGPMHWRGDRTGENPGIGESIEFAAFKEFNAAFPELLGRSTPVSDAQMSAFAEFALEITYPPNPIRSLDNSLSESQSTGRDIYMNNRTTGENFTCNDCHTLDADRGHFGTSGLSSLEGPDISQDFKVPHLRNMYQKVGKFGNSGRFSNTDIEFGDQIRGFGFMHDGNMDTLDNFLQGGVFRFSLNPDVNDRMRSNVVDFVMAFDSDLAPIVGQQVTVSSRTGEDSLARLNLLRERASVTPAECDLIAKGVVEGESRGFLMRADGTFSSDRAGEQFSFAQMQQLAITDNGAMTFTCTPPGSGTWMGIDRDENGILDQDQ